MATPSLSTAPPLILPDPADTETSDITPDLAKWLQHRERLGLAGVGPIAQLEEHMASLTGHKFAVALSSASMGLWAALRAVDVSSSEVLVSDYDWPAAAAACIAANGHPCVVDVEPDTGLVSSRTISAARTAPPPKAVVVTHLGGRAVDTSELATEARRQGAVLIEDCAQAFGAMRNGIPVGSHGDAAVFSFGPGKLVDAGEGGVLVTSNEAIYQAVLRLTQHPSYQRLHGVDPCYLHLNGRMHPCAAIVAVHELNLYAARLERLRANASALEGRLSNIPGFHFPPRCSTEPSWWTVSALCDEAAWGFSTDHVVIKLQQFGIPVGRGPITQTVSQLLRASGHMSLSHANASIWAKRAVHFACNDANPHQFAVYAQELGERVQWLFWRR